ncbi:MAG TPA: BON domain-containing protein [Terriglobales bacterium]|jgi:osmotically-inducible protein OsmY|nr:BON domain-containing protein [Terriglobales bacterium]
MKKHSFAKAAFLAVICLVFTLAAAAQGEYSGGSQQKPDQSSTSQQKPDQDQSVQQKTEAQAPAQAIQEEFKQDPAFSKVTVNSDAKQITLHGTVTSKADHDKAQQIAEQHASGRKVVNKIKVNKNTNPGPGL